MSDANQKPSPVSVSCPHCNSRVPVISDCEWNALKCPSCSIPFNLISGDPDASSLSGIQSVGRFEVLEQVGLGAFGTVWKAYDPQLERAVQVALEMLERNPVQLKPQPPDPIRSRRPN